MAAGDAEKKPRTGDILKAAREVFARHGYRKTTIEDIAHRLGMVKSALYYYYPNKQELFIAVVEHEALLFFENIRGLLDAGSTVGEKLAIYARQSNKYHQDFNNLYNLTVDDIFQNYKGLVRIRNKFIGRNVDLVAELLETGGRVAAPDIRQAARLFIYALGGIFQNYQLEEKPVPDGILTSFVTIFHRGLYQ
ncbi:MAG: TetR/AcrR family transcriptional regulator [Spirochaetes bacterium]|nr:TetR/AcrR family transcriptional regulator [Spirochaetota bacterium]HPA71263.1 TetR/AcrR family transcriptional regulator [Spirochaetota bacterium]